MFYAVKSTIMFVAASLILVVGIVAVAVPNAVEAGKDKPLTQFCIDGIVATGNCAGTMQDCKVLLENIIGKHKCSRV